LHPFFFQKKTCKLIIFFKKNKRLEEFSNLMLKMLKEKPNLGLLM